MTFGLTAQGFQRKRLEDIKSDIEADLRAEIRSDIDLSSESLYGQIVGVLSKPIALLWELAEHNYLAFDPDYAEGVSLDGICAITGIRRLDATETTSVAALIGDNGTTIDAGKIVQNSQTKDLYILDVAVQISSASLIYARIRVSDLDANGAYSVTINGDAFSIEADSSPTEAEISAALAAEIIYAGVVASVDDSDVILKAEDTSAPFSLSVGAGLAIAQRGSPGQVTAQVAGAKFLPAGALDAIVTPVSGWTGVLNLEDGLIGRDREEEITLRRRRTETVSFPASASVDSIEAKLRNTASVISAKVVENKTDTVDENGVPGHTIWAIVLGGTDEEIGAILFPKVAGGIGTKGSVAVVVVGENGQEFEVNFDRPEVIDVYVKATLDEAIGYPSDGDDQIKTALVKFAQTSLAIGSTLSFSRLYTPINSVPGHDVDDLRIGTGPSPTGQVPIGAEVNQLLRIQLANITIEEAP